MSCGIENLKCGVKWLDDVFETYEEVQIGMEVPHCIKNIVALKKNLLSAVIAEIRTAGIESPYDAGLVDPHHFMPNTNRIQMGMDNKVWQRAIQAAIARFGVVRTLETEQYEEMWIVTEKGVAALGAELGEQK